MQLMLEWRELRGLMRMGTPDLETAKEDAKQLIKEGKTATVVVIDLDTSYPYKKIAGWKRPSPKGTSDVPAR